MSSILRTAPPNFDLAAACASCHTTLPELSEHTGIPEEELVAFSSGASGLSPRDWFAIMTGLCEAAPPVQRGAETRSLSLAAHKALMRDVDEQDREENPE